LPAHVGEDGTCIGETQRAGCTAGKRVGDERAFVRPPAVNGGFADARIIGNIFDGKLGKTAASQEAKSAAENGLTGLFAAGTPRRPFAISISIFAV
jgi:hypothetical protein